MAWKTSQMLILYIQKNLYSRKTSVKRKIYWMEKNYQNKERKCTTSGGTDHNNTTCKGGPVGSNPKKKRVNIECHVDGDNFVERTSSLKKMRKKAPKPTSASTNKTTASTSSYTKKSATPSTTSKKKSASSSSALMSSSKRKVTTAPSTFSGAFNKIFKGTINIKNQTINNIEAPSKRQSKPNSKYA